MNLESKSSFLIYSAYYFNISEELFVFCCMFDIFLGSMLWDTELVLCSRRLTKYVIFDFEENIHGCMCVGSARIVFWTRA